MSIRDFKCHVKSYEKRLEIAFYENNCKRHRETGTIVGHSKGAAFAVCKIKNCKTSTKGK